jgi:hypothetical protein
VVVSILEEKYRLTFTTIPDGNRLVGQKPWIVRQKLLTPMVIETTGSALNELKNLK